MGRPLKEIKLDGAVVQRLASRGLTLEEIAAVLGFGTTTIDRRFGEELKKGREIMKSSLKRKQFSVAMKGNVTMLIWLGKQYLGQTDKLVQQVENGDTTVVIKRVDAVG